MLETNLVIMKNNWKQLWLHIVFATVVCILSPILFRIHSLSKEQTAFVIEFYLSLIGVILLVPVFLPEQNKSIREILFSKRIPFTVIWAKRIAGQLIVLTTLDFIYLKVLEMNNCDFPFWKFLYAVMAESLFLGGLGIFIYAITDNWICGYIIPLIYYIICYGGKTNTILDNIYLFSLQYGSITEKYFLFAGGLLCILLSLVIREIANH